VLHDAFFKYQTKPKLTHHGDLYHEGKEFKVKLREMKPGVLSQELKDALGMPEGAPPPWLINMQVCETVKRGSVSLGSRVLFLRLKVVISEFDVGNTIV
jgi:hypothetical protein